MDNHQIASDLGADRVAYTPAEAAKVVGLSVDTIRVAYRSGALKAYRPSPKRVTIMRHHLIEWIEASESAS